MDNNGIQDIPKMSIGEFSLQHLRKNASSGNQTAQVGRNVWRRFEINEQVLRLEVFFDHLNCFDILLLASNDDLAKINVMVRNAITRSGGDFEF